MIMATRAGLMSGQDKKKLDEFSAVSNETGKFMGADGKWSVPKYDDSWATEHLTISGGAEGLDVKRSSGAVEFTIPIATSLGAGVMSSADKIKLDGAASVGHSHSEYASSTHVHAASAITSGTLAVARGGTGLTSSPSMLTNLASTTAANVMAASPRPGVTGTLGVANGGTGASDTATARSNLGALPLLHMHMPAYIATESKYYNKQVKLAKVTYVGGFELKNYAFCYWWNQKANTHAGPIYLNYNSTGDFPLLIPDMVSGEVKENGWGYSYVPPTALVSGTYRLLVMGGTEEIPWVYIIQNGPIGYWKVVLAQ